MTSKKYEKMTALEMLRAKFGLIDFDKLTAVEADERMDAIEDFAGPFDGLKMMNGMVVQQNG